MLRTLKARLRQLWEQCDLFEPPPGRIPAPAPDPVTPSETRTRRRRKARQPGEGGGIELAARPARPPRAKAQDRANIERLVAAHQQYNAELFGNVLHPVAIRISGRMKNRLGHYMAALPGRGLEPEIAISRRHIRRDAWDEVLHTLVHEMVHQWQDESGLPIDHGAHFRRKAREVGITARATRRVA